MILLLVIGAALLSALDFSTDSSSTQTSYTCPTGQQVSDLEDCPPPPPIIGKTECATARVTPTILSIEIRGGATLSIPIGWIAPDGLMRVHVGFIRDEDLGQTYSIVRSGADGRVMRHWVAPDDPLVHNIPWAVVNTQYTVPECVVSAVPLDDQYPAQGQLVRRFRSSDVRIFQHVGDRKWRLVPDEGTFQEMGLYWCNVTSADAEFFSRITISEPFASSGTVPRDDYPNCWNQV